MTGVGPDHRYVSVRQRDFILAVADPTTIWTLVTFSRPDLQPILPNRSGELIE